MTELHSVGLPHSVIRGSQDVCSSPRLFAAYHDLLRRIAPRHPPWTLVRLTIFLLHPLTLTCSLNRGSLPAAHTRTLSASLSTLPRASGLLFPFPYLSKNNPQRASALRYRNCPAVRQVSRGTMGLTRLELVTPSLSEKCSNRLSYRPKKRREGNGVGSAG